MLLKALEVSVTLRPKPWGKKQTNAFPRLLEMKVDEIVVKGHKTVRTSRERIQKSKIVNRSARQLNRGKPSAKEKIDLIL
jgi:hypothetical protein